MTATVDTARAAAGAGLRLGRSLPVIGGLLGRSARLELTGRVVLVTGAARGLGREISTLAHAHGAHIALTGRTLAPLEELADELGHRTAAFHADVSDPASLQRAADAAARHFGGIDVVVANAGIAAPTQSLLSIDPDDFERIVDIDLLGQWRTLRATLPHVVARGGHVVVVASIFAFLNGALNASYAASKAGVEQIVRAARVELAPHGATAGIAYLGFIDTELIADAFGQEHLQALRRAVPSFLTDPMPAAAAARAVVDGIEARSPRITAPRWVGPALATRGLLDAVIDEIMLGHPAFARAVGAAERR